MRIGRGLGVLAMLLAGAASLHAQQEATAEAEARSRELSERMRVTLEQQSRVLAQMQQDLERAARSDSRARDSIVRVTSQRISELANEIAKVQREADRVQSRMVDAQTREQLQAQIASARAMANVTRALSERQRALTFSTRAMPRGYLGVSLSAEQNTELRDGKVFTLFASPAVVASVEAGSPAADGGLQAGDTIISIGKATLTGAVPMAEVMTPGERVTIRVRRGGRERAMSVQIGTRQVYSYNSSTTGYGPGGFAVTSCSGDDCSVLLTAPAAPSATRSPPAPRSVPARAAPQAPAAPQAVSPMPTPRGSSWSSNDFSIAGAVMTSITSDLEELTGVDEGILVLRVAPGTPAATSGLRGGDVIIRINDDDCESVRDLQVAVQRASSKGLKRVALVVNRKQKEQSITLQW
jgi:C-terminal processing protease CtpA/Prc